LAPPFFWLFRVERHATTEAKAKAPSILLRQHYSDNWLQIVAWPTDRLERYELGTAFVVSDVEPKEERIGVKVLADGV
jgi:hypothetical protein